jgi:hypothetical protein
VHIPFRPWSPGLVGARMSTMAESYYVARGRRDPEWLAEQRAGALERERARREREPESFRAPTLAILPWPGSRLPARVSRRVSGTRSARP